MHCQLSPKLVEFGKIEGKKHKEVVRGRWSGPRKWLEEGLEARLMIGESSPMLKLMSMLERAWQVIFDGSFAN